MNIPTTTSEPAITPADLAARLAAGERVTVLDIRDDASWSIEAASAETVQVPALEAMADPGAVARRLSGPVAVVCNRGKTAVPVADALRAGGVDAAALEGGMQAWIGTLRALPVDLGVEGVAVRQVQRPGRGCLSYLLASDGRALVVDPAPDPDFYLSLAGELGATITDVVDTHVHADHLSGARELAERAGAALRLPAPSLERGLAYAAEVAPLADGDVIEIGGVEVRAIALPGHTTDMTGLLVANRALLSGDSLFADGIARPDLQRGDSEGAAAMARTLHATLHGSVLALGDDVVLLPGHDHPVVRSQAVAPSLAEARDAVPELRIADADEFARELVADLPPRPANYEAVIAVNSGHQPLDPELEVGGNSCATR